MKRAIFYTGFLAVILAVAIPLWRYNEFVYRQALLEAEKTPFRRVIREVRALPKKEPIKTVVKGIEEVKKMPPIREVRAVIKEIKEISLKYKVEPIKLFPFSDETALKEWEEKVFKGKVVYVVEKDGALSYVRAKSEGAASALYYKIKLDARKKHPVIRWKWRVERFPAKKTEESLEIENQDDFAARVYVIFVAPFITNSKVVEYIWAEKLSVGLTGTSPYSKNIKLMVLRSGRNGEPGTWSLEERDIVADYTALFGEPPERDVGAIAFMTNTEHTGTSADAMYDEITLGYTEDTDNGGGGGKREEQIATRTTLNQ